VSKVYFFISDIHLGLQDKVQEAAKEKKLVSFLKFAETNCDELFIVGDLFDYWFEYRRVYQKGFYRTLAALKDRISLERLLDAISQLKSAYKGQDRNMNRQLALDVLGNKIADSMI